MIDTRSMRFKNSIQHCKLDAVGQINLDKFGSLLAHIFFQQTKKNLEFSTRTVFF